MVELPIIGNLEEKGSNMSKNTSISLGDYFEDFVGNQVSAGRYKNVSEVIRAGLRLLEDEESKVAALRKAIQEGIDSGIAHDFDPEKHISKLKSKLERAEQSGFTTNSQDEILAKSKNKK